MFWLWNFYLPRFILSKCSGVGVCLMTYDLEIIYQLFPSLEFRSFTSCGSIFEMGGFFYPTRYNHWHTNYSSTQVDCQSTEAYLFSIFRIAFVFDFFVFYLTL